VSACPLTVYPRNVLLKHCPSSDVDIVCCNPLFGHNDFTDDSDSSSGAGGGVGGGSSSSNSGGDSSSTNDDNSGMQGWAGRTLVYDTIRAESDPGRLARIIDFFGSTGMCRTVRMGCEDIDLHVSDAEFVACLAGRVLAAGGGGGGSDDSGGGGNGRSYTTSTLPLTSSSIDDDEELLPPSPVPSSVECEALRNVADRFSKQHLSSSAHRPGCLDVFDPSLDRLYGMYRYNPRAGRHLERMRERLARVERELAARGAYLEARKMMRDVERDRMMEECRELVREVIKKESK